jgi:hypothetical protein
LFHPRLIIMIISATIFEVRFSALQTIPRKEPSRAPSQIPHPLW